MPQNNIFTYEDAGFNPFLVRSLKSNPGAQTLAARPSNAASATINFDMLQSSGAVTDNIRVGARLELQGNLGRLAVKDSQGNEVGWVGDLIS